jgi:cation:H+ antiporter
MWEMISLAAGFALLIFGANYLVDNASSLASRLRIPNLVIGLTIVAFGTSSPELVVSTVSSIQGNSGIALGNVVGSNIFNILAILGISAVIFPLAVKSTTTWIEIPLSLFSALLVFILANFGSAYNSGYGVISRTGGIILLSIFLAFVFYNYHLSKKGDITDNIKVREQSIKRSVFMIIAGLAMLVGGGRLVVLSSVKLALEIGVPERIIGLTIVAVGTSLPELVTSVAAALKGNTDIAIGNIVGSNIFNIFLILGVSAVIYPVPLVKGANIDLLVNIFANLLLFAFIFSGKGRKIERWEGMVFIIAYLLYIAFILFRQVPG